MTAKKPPIPSHIEIHPQFSYRLNDPVSVHVTGLAPPQQREAAERGELAGEVPVKGRPSGRLLFWLGQQLLNIQEARLAEARARAERLAAKRAHEIAAPKGRSSRRRKVA